MSLDAVRGQRRPTKDSRAYGEPIVSLLHSLSGMLVYAR